MIELCKGDLLARERRNLLLSASDRTSLSRHLATCASCRLARQIGADFDAIDFDRPGDDARIERIAAALSQRTAPARRIALRARVTALLIAAAICLMAAAAFSARIWIRRASNARQSASAALDRPREPVAATLAPTVAEVASPPVAPTGSSPSNTRPGASHAAVPAPLAEDASATGLFTKANQLRHDGDVEGAIALYRRLEQKFPASAEARLSRVSQGRLLLEGGHAALALEQFDRYLGLPGGQLAAEALAGRARALGQLDRRREERDTWNRLLREFPGSVYAARARQRLTELD